MVVVRDLGDGSRVTGAIRSEQFLCLTSELIQIWVFAKSAERRMWTGHDELLPLSPYRRQPMGPVSALSGRREFIETMSCAARASFRWTQSFPRTRRRSGGAEGKITRRTRRGQTSAPGYGLQPAAEPATRRGRNVSHSCGIFW